MTLETITEIIDYVCSLREGFVVTRDTTWDDMDLDSLDMVEIIMEAEERLFMDIDDDISINWKNVGDALDYFNSIGK